ncbi:ubiquitinyl hydrolase 1 [Malassezia cuniculi]|uniref:Ubiquitin carboxyl-terminal hydrolase n=1 Tax=Malassezia cuniculi TaxID=948313 RepID=A0AAF0J6E5_9BASI|nr:ubiquitinyl hydrolase 1 [Malassezia cuniculi]
MAWKDSLRVALPDSPPSRSLPGPVAANIDAALKAGPTLASSPPPPGWSQTEWAIWSVDNGRSIHEDPVRPILPGIDNFGNTCYVNSVLQALYYCKPFRDTIMWNIDPSTTRGMISPATPRSFASSSTSNDDARHDSLFLALSRIFHQIARSSIATAIEQRTVRATSPASADSRKSSSNSIVESNVIRQFLRVLWRSNDMFDTTSHQDAHELLNFLLNKACEELEEPQHDNSQKNTTIRSLFEGVLTNETRCLTCETITSRDEAFLDLSVNITPNTSISSCLRHFSDSEMLCGRNKYFCDRCSSLQEAEKRMKILRPPNVLALHLKRFKWDEQVQAYVKLSSRVVFPLELRLFNTSEHADDPDRLYELCAIIVHSGEGSSQGHYVSIVRVGQRWALFDDEVVDFIPESDLCKYYEDSGDSGSAYVLLYQAKNLDSNEAQRPKTQAPHAQNSVPGGAHALAVAPAPSAVPTHLTPAPDPALPLVPVSAPIPTTTQTPASSQFEHGARAVPIHIAPRTATRPLSMPPEALSALMDFRGPSQPSHLGGSPPNGVGATATASASPRKMEWLPRRRSITPAVPLTAPTTGSRVASPPTLFVAPSDSASGSEPVRQQETARLPTKDEGNANSRKFTRGRSALSRTLRLGREKEKHKE